MVSEHASPLAVLGGEDAGGQNVHVAALSTALARRGCEVVVHTRRDDPALAPRVRLAPGVTVDHVDAGPPAQLPKDELLPHMAAFADELGERWSREPPDMVHAHFWMSGLAALAAATPLGIPVTQTFHALGVVKRRHQGAKDTSPPARIELEAGIARTVDGILATCSDEVFELLRLGADRRRIRVVPCGVNLRRFTPHGPAAARTPGRRRVVCVGRLVERKGVGNLVTAMAGVPDAELLIAGGPAPEDLDKTPEPRRLMALAEQHGVADRVRLLGRVERDALPALLRSADVVACVPWYEPFGIVPLEAMACGVPVVASAVGGLIDTVVDGVTGLHVPPRRPERVAAAINRLLDDGALAQSLGRAGARRARRRYGWDRIAASTFECYEQLARTARRDLAEVPIR
jgi:glycosyltransferase involved in cell wall biosynthesis